MGGLVGQVSGDDEVPVLGLVQQLGVQASQVQPGLFGPRFVGVLGQQLASVHGERRLGRRNAAVGDRRLGVLLEPRSVDVHVVIGVQPYVVGIEDDGAAVAQGLAGVVRRLVQPRDARSTPRSGHSASMTCSRCRLRPGTRASSLTSAALCRRDQWRGGTVRPSTRTWKPPSSRTWIRAEAATGVPGPRRSRLRRRRAAPPRGRIPAWPSQASSALPAQQGVASAGPAVSASPVDACSVAGSSASTV